MNEILGLLFLDKDNESIKKQLEIIFTITKLKTQNPNLKVTLGLISSDFNTENIKELSLVRDGIDKILIISKKELEFKNSNFDIQAVDYLLKDMDLDLIISNYSLRSTIALTSYAAKENISIDSKVANINYTDGKLLIEKWIYKQRMLAKYYYIKSPLVLLQERKIYSDSEDYKEFLSNIFTNTPNVSELDYIDLSDGLCLKGSSTKFIKEEKIKENLDTIRPDAELLFVAGAGWTKSQSNKEKTSQEVENIILQFIEKTNCSLGTSKSLVDLNNDESKGISFVSPLNQVGQTGSSPRHLKGLATCCHGEEPHVVGWRFVKEIRAVNLDSNCGWAQNKADVLYVGDAIEVVKKINELL